MMSLIEMTLEGSVIIMAIILVRSLTIHHLPKKAFLLLWAVALTRLLLPVRISSPASIYTVTPGLSDTGRSGILLPGMAAQASAATSERVAVSISFWSIVWLAGGLLLALGILICHIRNRRIYRTSLPAESQWVRQWIECHRLRRPVFLRYSDQIEAPLTYGVLWPVILLPAEIDWSDEALLGFILAHEMSHIRRFDALIKWFLAAALCLHWFNPLVWAMYILANRDLEISCDESVLHLYGQQSRADYALTLVGMEERRTEFAPLANCFSRNALKERITAIMKSPEKSVKNLAASAVLIGVITIVFATSAPAGRASAREGQNVASSGGNSSQVPVTTSRETDISDGVQTISREMVQESVSDAEYPQEPSYTKAQYQELLKRIKLKGYEEMSIAEFNRRINALLSAENDGQRELYEQILAFLPADDPEADYLCNTVQASLGEYSARMDEVFSGEQNDPVFYGSVELELEEDVFGDRVVTGGRHADYEFSYRILHQDKLTVKERDDFLQNIMHSMQDYADENCEDPFTEEGLRKILTTAGKKYATDKISFTSGKITNIESY